jgi:hypothetical protein
MARKYTQPYVGHKKAGGGFNNPHTLTVTATERIAAYEAAK